MEIDFNLEKEYRAQFKLKIVEILLGFLAFFLFLLLFGLYSYGHVSIGHHFSRMSAVESIFAGGLGTVLIGQTLLLYIMRARYGYPRLTLSSQQIVYQYSLRKEPIIASWSSLGPFEIKSFSSKRKAYFVQSKVTGPDINEAAKKQIDRNNGNLRIPIVFLNVDINSLSDEMNQRRTYALGKK